jgi:hypothetical protein
MSGHPGLQYAIPFCNPFFLFIKESGIERMSDGANNFPCSFSWQLRIGVERKNIFYFTQNFDIANDVLKNVLFLSREAMPSGLPVFHASVHCPSILALRHSIFLGGEKSKRDH